MSLEKIADADAFTVCTWPHYLVSARACIGLDHATYSTHEVTLKGELCSVAVQADPMTQWLNSWYDICQLPRMTLALPFQPINLLTPICKSLLGYLLRHMQHSALPEAADCPHRSQAFDMLGTLEFAVVQRPGMLMPEVKV